MTAQRDKKAREQAYMQGFMDGAEMMYWFSHPQEAVSAIQLAGDSLKKIMQALQGKKEEAHNETSLPDPLPETNVGNELDTP